MPDLWFDDTNTDKHEHYPRMRTTVDDWNNDSHVCAICHKHVDEIAGDLEGHAPDCSWALTHLARQAAGHNIRSVPLSHNKYVEVIAGRVADGSVTTAQNPNGQ